MQHIDPESLMRETSQQVRPCLIFRFKMKYRLMKKHWEIYFCRPGAKLRFTAALMVIFVASTGSVGAYAYSSPDVNILHPLYPVKQSIESAELQIAATPESRSRTLLNRAHHRMAEVERMQSLTGDGDRDMDDAIGKTFEMMDSDVKMSIVSAAVEHDPEAADRIAAHMEHHLQTMQVGLKKLADSGIHCQREAVKKRLQTMDQFAQSKIERLRTARSKIRDARLRSEKQIFLRELMEEPGPSFLMPRPE